MLAGEFELISARTVGIYVPDGKDDFVGKDALAKLKGRPNRKKVTFEFNREDVRKDTAIGFEDGTPYKWLNFPQPDYASSSADMIMRDRKMVGISTFNGYSFKERCCLNLGVVDATSKSASY